ncbi:MAG: Nif11-like leader peptide family RiPP precursor [Lachnospiraceae bacterium]|nr:Nif11-like leader peptide family RiPP precursor [Lachnospiraceae bacterium]
MTETMKKFLAKVSADQALTKRLQAADDYGQIIALANELGIELTMTDIVPPEGEISEKELDAVAGGAYCVCFVGGGGEASRGYKVCACVLGGGGETEHGDARCVCVGAGEGEDYAKFD